ncbi:MAG: hypothetical protein FH761_16585 [Firmicutes bacterium]|nr:hypothetical protein [Bacillota bacterium]
MSKTGFKFNNLDSSVYYTSDDFELIVLSQNIPLFAQDRVAKKTVIDRDGQLTFRDGKNNKTITMECKLVSNDSLDKLRTAKELALWLNGYGELVINMEPDIKYQAQLLNEIQIDKTNFFVDSFILAWDVKPINVQNYSNNPKVNDPIAVDAKAPVDGFVTSIDVNGTGSITLQNVGTYKSYSAITIDGTADSITIQNTTTSESFTITSITETTYIDCENLEVYTSGPTSKLSDFSGCFWAINVGNNEISITGTNVNATINFDYRQKYL